mmetsp:Transcript_29335/g.86773  ORF Transcript_29335/g.86773 Transcript_29335/m.86773 type:complete len:367 (+) Transcript_29335:231-1331(+)
MPATATVVARGAATQAAAAAATRTAAAVATVLAARVAAHAGGLSPHAATRTRKRGVRCAARSSRGVEVAAAARRQRQRERPAAGGGRPGRRNERAAWLRVRSRQREHRSGQCRTAVPEACMPPDDSGGALEAALVQQRPSQVGAQKVQQQEQVAERRRCCLWRPAPLHQRARAVRCAQTTHTDKNRRRAVSAHALHLERQDAQHLLQLDALLALQHRRHVLQRQRLVAQQVWVVRRHCGAVRCQLRAARRQRRAAAIVCGASRLHGHACCIEPLLERLPRSGRVVHGALRRAALSRLHPRLSLRAAQLAQQRQQLRFFSAKRCQLLATLLVQQAQAVGAKVPSSACVANTATVTQRSLLLVLLQQQ